IHHCGTHSRLTSLQMLTTGQYYLFMCDIFIRRMCMRICYVHYLAGWLYIRKTEMSFCVGICTDGAAAMTGRLSGLTARIKEVAPECESMHCVINRDISQMTADLKVCSRQQLCGVLD
uniref:Uncharacterized protein n=1 Tax=Cyprinus carpio carpio TaxID=630221 RepID=A0A9J7YFM2_CYPCA